MPKKKTKVKDEKKVKRQCKTPECKRFAFGEEEYCPKCGGPEASLLPPGHKGITELEALRYAKAHSDIMLARKEITLIDYRISKTERELLDKVTLLKTKKKEAEQQIEQLNPGYLSIMRALSKKYEIPIDRLLVDPELRAVADREVLEN